MAVDFLAAGTSASGTATATPGMPAGAADGDLLVLVVEGEGENASADGVPTGWTVLDSVASAIDGAADRTRCTVAWAWHDAGISRVVPDAGNHTLAQIFAFRGDIDPTTPIESYGSGSSATNSTSHSADTGLTTTRPGSLVGLGFVHGDDGTTIGSVANTSLDSAALADASTTTINSDGTVGLLYGTLTVPGAAGTFTWTSGVSEERAWVAFVVQPVEPGPISHVGADWAVSSGALSTFEVDLPATVEDDDVAVLVLHTVNGTDRGLPTSGVDGWNLIVNHGGGSNIYRVMAWWKALTAADAGDPVTVSMSGITGAFLAVNVLRGVDPDSPIAGGDGVGYSADRNTTNNSTAEYGSVAPGVDDAWVLSSIGASQPVTFSPPSGFTETTDSGSTNRGGETAYQAQGAAGTVAPADFALGTATTWGTLLVALVPGEGGGPPGGGGGTGEVSYVGGDVDSTLGSQTTSLTVTIPTVETGDVAFLIIDSIIGSDGGEPTGGLSGWTLEAEVPGGNTIARHSVYSKVLDAADSATTVTPTYSAGRWWSISVQVWRGVDPTNPVGAVGTRADGTGTTATFNSLTTTVENAAVVSVVAVRESQSDISFSTATERTDASGGGTTLRNHATASTATTTPGSTSLGTASFSASSYWSAWSFEVVPLPASDPTSELWDGSAWVPAALELWSGSAWVPAVSQIWNGSAWV